MVTIRTGIVVKLYETIYTIVEGCFFFGYMQEEKLCYLAERLAIHIEKREIKSEY